jgi:chemotaxis response regulator CheB
MRLRPMPVVMVSSLTGKGSEITVKELALMAERSDARASSAEGFTNTFYT